MVVVGVVVVVVMVVVVVVMVGVVVVVLVVCVSCWYGPEKPLVLRRNQGWMHVHHMQPLTLQGQEDS